MSTALYRRYRPETFADVIGQEHVTEPLMTALQKNRVNHAYLFSGPRGCGKTTSARILARCLNCAEGPTPTPCGHCESCRDLARDGAGSLDVIEMDAASHGGVDHARDLRERATFAPVRDRYKIFIIDEAHMVTREGFNALLKIVEEPPEHIKFIFATTEPNKVLGTIRSRTHHYPFRLVAPEVLRGYLQELCQKEGIAVEQGVLPLVVRAGGGSVRDSLSVLDQLMGGSGEQGITYDLAVALLGFTHAELLDGVVDAFAAGDSPAVFQAVDRVIQTGQDPRRFVEDLLERFRDLIIVKAVPDSAASVLHGMPEDQVDRMRGQAQQLGAAELSRAADITNTALTEMTGATSPQLHLELLCARILLPTADDSSRGVNARVDRLERRINLGTVGAVAAPLQQDPAALTTPETPAEHAAAQADGVQDAPAPAADGREAALALARRNRAVPPGQQDQDPDQSQPPVQDQAQPRSEASQEAAPRPSAAPEPSAASAEPSAGSAGPASGNGGGAPSAPQREENTAPAASGYQPQPTAAPDAGQVNMIERSWADVVAAVGKRSKVAQATFRDCRPARFENGVLFVASHGPGIQSRVERYAGALAEALQETLGIACRVVLDGGGSGGGSGPTSGPGGTGGSGGSGGIDGFGAPGGPSRAASTPGTPSPRAAARNAPEEDWPDESRWNQAARQQQEGSQAPSHAPTQSQNPAPGQGSPQAGESGARRGSSAESMRQDPSRPSKAGPGPRLEDGPRSGEEAWQEHGRPMDQAAPAWSEDAEGETFGDWAVAAIPGDSAAREDADPDESAQDQDASARPATASLTVVPSLPEDPALPEGQGASDASPEGTRYEGSSDTPQGTEGPANPGPAAHDAGIPADPAASAAEASGDGATTPMAEGGPSAPDDAPAGDFSPGSDQTERAILDDQDAPVQTAPEPATTGHPSAHSPRDADRPAHDWSVAAREAGAPGAPVDGRSSGWGYSGPDSRTGNAEHPSRWGQRAPRLVGAPAPGQAEDPGAGNPGTDSGPAPERPRHLHAVPNEGEAPQPAEAPVQSQASEPPQNLSFRERHAAAFAAGASHAGPSGIQAPENGTAGPVPGGSRRGTAPEPPDDWDDFAPEPEDEDIEDSSVFGQAAIETILGGRVIDERPRQRMS